MRVISVIDDEDVIKKILKHLGLWNQKARPPPKATRAPKIHEYKIDYTNSQLPVSDKWLYVDQEYTETYPSGYLKWKNLHILYLGPGQYFLILLLSFNLSISKIYSTNQKKIRYPKVKVTITEEEK